MVTGTTTTEDSNKPNEAESTEEETTGTANKDKENILKEKDNNVLQLTSELKKRNEKLKKKQEKLEELKEVEKEFLEFMKKVANSDINVTNIKQINMYYIVNNFKEALNYEDLMKKPLTIDEKQYVLENGGVDGCYHILFNRCINGIDVNKRPFHCL